MHLGIDFWSILVDLGGKLGRKIDQKSIQKGIEKKDGKRNGIGTAKKSHQEASTALGPGGPDPWEGVRGRDKSLPEGKREE